MSGTSGFVSTLRRQGATLLELAREVTALRKTGASWRGRCPFHEGANPQSFEVSVRHARFRCHACGVRGNPIDFLMRRDGVAFWPACQRIAARSGVARPAGQSGPAGPRIDAQGKHVSSEGPAGRLLERLGLDEAAEDFGLTVDAVRGDLLLPVHAAGEGRASRRRYLRYRAADPPEPIGAEEEEAAGPSGTLMFGPAGRSPGRGWVLFVLDPILMVRLAGLGVPNTVSVANASRAAGEPYLTAGQARRLSLACGPALTEVRLIVPPGGSGVGGDPASEAALHRTESVLLAVGIEPVLLVGPEDGPEDLFGWSWLPRLLAQEGADALDQPGRLRDVFELRVERLGRTRLPTREVLLRVARVLRPLRSSNPLLFEAYRAWVLARLPALSPEGLNAELARPPLE